MQVTTTRAWQPPWMPSRARFAPVSPVLRSPSISACPSCAVWRAIPRHDCAARLCARVAGCMWSCRCGACLCVSSWARLCARVLVLMRVCLPYLRRCLCGREAVAVSHHAAADGRGLLCNSCSSKDALNALLAHHVLEASTLRKYHSCSLFRTLTPGTLEQFSIATAGLCKLRSQVCIILESIVCAQLRARVCMDV